MLRYFIHKPELNQDFVWQCETLFKKNLLTEITDKTKYIMCGHSTALNLSHSRLVHKEKEPLLSSMVVEV